MSRKWMQMELTQSARWLITFYRRNTRLMTGVTKPVSHYGYHYYYLLFLRVSIEYRGIIYLRVWVCTMPWFLLPKAFHKIDCIGLQKYSLLQQTCRKYSLTFCDRQWWQTEAPLWLNSHLAGCHVINIDWKFFNFVLFQCMLYQPCFLWS